MYVALLVKTVAPALVPTHVSVLLVGVEMAV